MIRAMRAGSHDPSDAALENIAAIGINPKTYDTLSDLQHSPKTGHKGWQHVVVIAVCLLWTGVSSGAILVNKHILVDLRFPYPVTIAFMGLVTTTACSAVAVRLIVPRAQRQHVSTQHYFKRVLPTGFCMALTFHTGNMAYLYLSVAFIQMLKALCPVITMVLLFMFRLEKATTKLVVSVVIISSGVAVASYGELNMSVFGLTSMLTSVVAESVRLVLTQYLLVGTSQMLHPFEGLTLIGSACSMCLLVQALIWEWGQLVSTGALSIVGQYPLHFALAACAGFGVNALAILVIKLASSLTLKVLGTVKDAALVTAGVVFMHEQVSSLQLQGYVVSLLGFGMYNYIKSQNLHQKPLLPQFQSKTA
uniref:Sugar phosphate transporter domain-containing protein n=1 Tax=Chlamydomonas leiostraca TaxID=1034604 RepID=A0A7S0RY75_9CHLO|mmetsp:Transcript_34785/g.88116  ORF Transcript_34785/g.88116 Transcript_34785/m.88116 type:complete len:364 (+) Transcript_34785:84-1175(+)|eukprot:CAMPEP_0202861782 /NCGR_PEP_ID=MMETSP1391-20130828/3063_1 /ASSEMBLY_ACC=CAM_ASM_000867 /TAXON_ID=1034604 /ORGANISM="Chlamydomonas leiostraca, Strain SAG 11-49" /LENGTH=363 /DNA_ID=CAMNT_0049541219 /DNA_START=39 /DNA_END=1130 /DNA_ORIENTATION=+